MNSKILKFIVAEQACEIRRAKQERIWGRERGVTLSAFLRGLPGGIDNDHSHTNPSKSILGPHYSSILYITGFYR